MGENTLTPRPHGNPTESSDNHHFTIESQFTQKNQLPVRRNQKGKKDKT